MAPITRDGDKLLWSGQVVGEAGKATVAAGEELRKVMVVPWASYSLAPMPGGDVLLPTESGVVGVERKRLDNLVASWYNGELAVQLGIMLDCYDHTVLLCEGEDLAAEFVRFKDAAAFRRKLQQDLVTLQAAGVRVVWSAGLEDSGELVRELWDYYSRPVHHALDRKEAQDKSVYRRMLLAVPGWGSETVTSVLKTIGPPIKVFTAGAEELLAVKNVTPRRLKYLFEALGRKVKT